MSRRRALHVSPVDGVVAGNPAVLNHLNRRLPRDGKSGSFRSRRRDGAIAQLGERFHGMEEVVGSIPSGSTKQSVKTCDFYLSAGSAVLSVG